MSTAAPEAPTKMPELSPAVTLNIVADEQAAWQRLNFDAMTEHEQVDYLDAHPAGAEESYMNRVHTGDRSVVVATTTHLGHDNADSLATHVVSETLSDNLQDRDFDGATGDEAAELIKEALFIANDRLLEAKMGTDNPAAWDVAEASVTGIRFYRDNEGSQKAAIINAGDNRVLRFRGDISEVITEPQVDPYTNEPVNTITGHDVNGSWQIEDVEAGDRYVVVDSRMADGNGIPLSATQLANVGGPKAERKTDEATLKMSKLTDKLQEDGGLDAAGDPNFEAPIGDLTIVSIDVERSRNWNPVEKVLRAGTRAAVWAQIRRDGRRVHNRERYQENPTWWRRAAVAADAGILAVGAYVGYRLVGAGIGLGHELAGHDGAVGDAFSHHVNSTAPSPSASHPGGNPFDNLKSPAASPNVGNGAVAHTGAETPGATTAPGNIDLEHLDPNHLPAGVKLTDDEIKWLHEIRGEGSIGEYHSTTGPDGLGNKGTVWHSAMESLKDAGYDPSKMTSDEKTAYVQHVLDLNHLSWDQAANESNDFTPVMPTNQDIFAQVTHLTGGHDGGPLMPSANSDMGHHLNDIKATVASQVGSHHNGGHPGSTDGTGSTGGRVPTDNGTPVATVHPTTATPSHPTSQPTTHATTTHPAPSASSSHAVAGPAGTGSHESGFDQFVDAMSSKTALSVEAAVAATSLAAIGNTMYRNRDRNEIIKTNPMPDVVRNSTPANGPEEDDEDDLGLLDDHAQQKPIRLRTGKPRQSPGSVPPPFNPNAK